MFAAAACGDELTEHTRYELPPGDFWDLRELQREVRQGTFRPIVWDAPSDEEAGRGRAALRDMGAGRLFTETAAGSWVIGCGREVCR